MANLFSAADMERLEKEVRADAAAAPQSIKDLSASYSPMPRRRSTLF